MVGRRDRLFPPPAALPSPGSAEPGGGDAAVPLPQAELRDVVRGEVSFSG